MRFPRVRSRERTTKRKGRRLSVRFHDGFDFTVKLTQLYGVLARLVQVNVTGDVDSIVF
jgi:hypothetical protein